MAPTLLGAERATAAGAGLCPPGSRGRRCGTGLGGGGVCPTSSRRAEPRAAFQDVRCATGGLRGRKKPPRGKCPGTRGQMASRGLCSPSWAVTACRVSPSIEAPPGTGPWPVPGGLGLVGASPAPQTPEEAERSLSGAAELTFGPRRARVLPRTLGRHHSADVTPPPAASEASAPAWGPVGAQRQRASGR